MILEDHDQPLPLPLVATKDLVSELQGRFDVFSASGIKVRKEDDISFQFGVKGSPFDVISMLEYLKVEIIVRSIEENNGNGNRTKDFD
tara:strand:+ start:30 stop:293 length:264 start_codon:yes stop_codon:yes gene_type:complete